MVVDGMVSKGGGVLVGMMGLIGHNRLIRHDKGIGLLGCLLRLWGGCGRWGRNSVQFVHFFWCWGWGGCIFAEDKLRLGIDCK